MTVLRTIAEVGIGLLFGIGAIFNAVYTLSHREEFYGSFADGAWFGSARWIIDRIVLPNAVAFTLLVILFQGVVAIMILTRGDLVGAALIAGAAFAGAAALASSPGGTVGNLALAGVQIALVLAR